MQQASEPTYVIDSSYLMDDEQLNAYINWKLSDVFGCKFYESLSFVVPFPGNGTIEAEDDGKQYYVAVLPAAARDVQRLPFHYYFDKLTQQAPPKRSEVENPSSDSDEDYVDHRKDVFDDLKPLIEANENANFKILFPYNLGMHWNTAEVRIYKKGSKYDVILEAHDPYGGGSLTLQNLRILTATVKRRLKECDSSATISFPLAADKSYSRRQAVGDGTSCGPITAEDILNRVYGRSLTPKHAYPIGATHLRQAQLDFMMKTLPHGDPTACNFRDKVTKVVASHARVVATPPTAPSATPSTAPSTTPSTAPSTTPLTVIESSKPRDVIKAILAGTVKTIEDYLSVMQKYDAYGIESGRLLRTSDLAVAKELAMAACYYSLPNETILPHRFIEQSRRELRNDLGFSLEAAATFIQNCSDTGFLTTEGYSDKAQHELFWSILWHYTLISDFEGKEAELASLTMMQILLGNTRCLAFLDKQSVTVTLNDLVATPWEQGDVAMGRYVMDMIFKQNVDTLSPVADILPKVARLFDEAFFTAETSLNDVYRISSWVIGLAKKLINKPDELNAVLTTLTQASLESLLALCEADISWSERPLTNWTIDDIKGYCQGEHDFYLPAFVFCLTDNGRRIVQHDKKVPQLLKSNDPERLNISTEKFQTHLGGRDTESLSVYFTVFTRFQALDIAPREFLENNKNLLEKLGNDNIAKLDDYALSLCHMSNGYFNCFEQIDVEKLQQFADAIRAQMTAFSGEEAIDIDAFKQALSFMPNLTLGDMPGVYRDPTLFRTGCYISHHVPQSLLDKVMRCYPLKDLSTRLMIKDMPNWETQATELSDLITAAEKELETPSVPSAAPSIPSRILQPDMTDAFASVFADATKNLPLLTQAQVDEYDQVTQRAKAEGSRDYHQRLLVLRDLQNNPFVAALLKGFTFPIQKAIDGNQLGPMAEVTEAMAISNIQALMPNSQGSFFMQYGHAARMAVFLNTLRYIDVELTPKLVEQFELALNRLIQIPDQVHKVEGLYDFMQRASWLANLNLSEALTDEQWFRVLTFLVSLQETLSKSMHDLTLALFAELFHLKQFEASASVFLQNLCQSIVELGRDVKTEKPAELLFFLGYCHLIAKPEPGVGSFRAFFQRLESQSFDADFVELFSSEMDTKARFAMVVTWYVDHYDGASELCQARLFSALDNTYEASEWRAMPEDVRTHMQAFFTAHRAEFEGRAITAFLENPSQPTTVSESIMALHGLGVFGGLQNRSPLAPLSGAGSTSVAGRAYPNMGSSGFNLGDDIDLDGYPSP